MSLKASELEAELIDAVCARLRERLPESQIAAGQAFVRQYYHWVPAEDLAERSPLDLYGAALAHWRLLVQRAPGEIKVRVYNPDADQDGWQSPHTVVEVITDDKPFLVDSVTMELARAGYGLDLVIHPVIRVRRDDEGRVLEVVAPEAEAPDALGESILHAEIRRESDPALLERLQRDVERVLGEVDAAVSDWPAMRAKALELVDELARTPPSMPAEERRQAQAIPRAGWPTTTSRSSASASTSSWSTTARRASRRCRTPGWGSCGAPRRSPTSSWGPGRRRSRGRRRRWS